MRHNYREAETVGFLTLRSQINVGLLLIILIILRLVKQQSNFFVSSVREMHVLEYDIVYVIMCVYVTVFCLLVGTLTLPPPS